MADLLIITTLQGELKSLLKMIPNHSGPQIDEKTKLVFYNAQLRSKIETNAFETIIIHSSEYGRVQATLSTSHAIKRWAPQYVFLVGIGGGVPDKVALGDILIASNVIDYSDRIENEQDTLFRPISYSVSKKMLNVAQTLDDDSWISRIKAKRPAPGTPQVHIGPIASSDSVVSSLEFFDKMRKKTPKLLGVEMEAGGVIAALEESNHKIDFFMIRAVSDLLDNNKNDKWQNYACDASAAFAVSFIRTFISITERSFNHNRVLGNKASDAEAVQKENRLENHSSYRKNDQFESDFNTASDDAVFQQPIKKIDKDDDSLHITKAAESFDTEHNTYLLTWNPMRFPFSNFAENARQVMEEGESNMNWSTGQRTHMSIGDRVFLMRHGEDRPGIVGSGHVAGQIFKAPHWERDKAEKGREANYADIRWDTLQEFPLISHEDLIIRTGEKKFWTNQGSGFEIKPELTEMIDQEWERARLGSGAKIDTAPPIRPRELLSPDLRTAAQLSSYRSDVAATKDRLGVVGDVENLCQVIMAKQWKPPLSIGLFGDWGSGKTSFINLMQHVIRGTARRAKESKDSAFVSDVIQIDFNAWHYMDANLWANLVVRILDGIHSAVFKRERSDEAGDEYKQIVANLNILQEEVDDVEAQGKQLTSAIGEIDSQIETKRGDSESAVGMIATLRAAVSDCDNAIAKEVKDIKDTLVKAAGDLGLDPETSLSETYSQAQKLVQLGTRLGSSWKSMRKQNILWFGLPIAIVGFWVWVKPDIGGIFNLPILQEILTIVTTLIALFISWTKSMAPHWKRIKAGLNAFETAYSKVENIRRGWLEVKQKELAELESKRNAVIGEISELETRKNHVQLQQMQLEERLEQLMQGRGLEEFLIDRAGSTDYQQQLGIISLVHQDMKQLQQKLQAGLIIDIDGTPPETRCYDRVILFIDDLDRCAPQRVVEVLQAIHLLLSIPLFVVVVAVDPRWLLQCLLTHYQDLLHGELDVGDYEWAVTPQNYLEKIFQIPYTLPPMASRDFSRYVADLFSINDQSSDTDKAAGNYSELKNEVSYLEIKTQRLQKKVHQQQVPAGKPEISADNAEVTSEKLKGDSNALVEEQARLTEAREKLRKAGDTLKTKQREVMAAKPTFDNKPKALDVPDQEQQFVTQLLPLLTTPRATKRLLNVYRLIRVSLDDDEIAAFEREEHQAVLVLLAVMYSFPAIAADFFTGLRNANESTILEYTQKINIDKENGDWFHLARAINKIPSVQDINIYRRWLNAVGRFSFQVGHELARKQS